MLRPSRTEEWLEKTHPKYIPGEAGGLISYTTASGVEWSIYAADPSGTNAVGVQRNDVEEFISPYHSYVHRVVHDIFSDQIEIIVRGDIETNFIHPNAQIWTGRVAYAGPSGLFTHDSSFGGNIVGYFLSEISAKSGPVIVEGGGIIRDVVVTHPDGTRQFNVVQEEGFPIRSVITPGFAKIRLDIQYGTPRI